jgi:chemotaxis protein CheD
MGSLIVGVGDCLVSGDPESVLVTYALGSCIGVMIHDPVARVGGLLHFMLPESGMDRAKAQRNPFMFADTGIPLLFRSAYELGAEKRRLVVAAAGGAQMLDQQGVFNIGKRNYLSMRKILWKAGVMVHTEDVGGLMSRTIRLEVSSGRMLLRGAGEREQEMPLASAAGKGVAEWRTTS